MLAQNVSRRRFPLVSLRRFFFFTGGFPTPMVGFFCHRDWAIQPEGCLAHTWSTRREPLQARHVTAECRLGLGAAGERAGQPSGSTLAGTRALFLVAIGLRRPGCQHVARHAAHTLFLQGNRGGGDFLSVLMPEGRPALRGGRPYGAAGLRGGRPEGRPA